MLTAEKVEEIFMDCLFRKEEINKGIPIKEPIKVEGLVNTFGFHPDRVKKHKEEIKSLLRELPDQFFKNGGGGWSFLNLCNTKDGEQWTGLHQRMEQLVCLGIAIGKVRYNLPRENWNILPGGVPYVSIDMDGGK